MIRGRIDVNIQNEKKKYRKETVVGDGENIYSNNPKNRKSCLDETIAFNL